MKIATWNVNSVRARLPAVLAWLRAAAPDIALLQEIKTTEDRFPRLEIEELGYNLALFGQPSYNGVAILSKLPLEDVRRGLPDEPEDQARYIEAVVSLGGGVVRVASLYLPNGNPAPSERYAYKLAWMAALCAHAADLLALEEPFVLGGDYNVIPTPRDVHNPEAWREDALFRLETRAAYRALVHLGLTDAFRACHAEAGRYSFWDYKAGAWAKNRGLRIDHLLLSPQAADLLQGSDIDAQLRGGEKPSDHVPVWCDLEV